MQTSKLDETLARIGVRARIYLGFGVLLVLMLALAAVSYNRFTVVETNIDDYVEMAGDRSLAKEFDTNMAKLQMAVGDYLRNPVTEEQAKVTTLIDAVAAEIAKAQASFQNPERVRLIGEIEEAKDGYVEAFAQVSAFMDERNTLVNETLNVVGLDARRKLSEISLSANNDGDVEAAYYAGRAQENLLLARLYAAKFLDTNDESAVERVRSEFTKMADALTTLDINLQNPTRRALLAEVIEAREVYLAAFNRLAAVIAERNAVIASGINATGDAILAKADAIVASLESDSGLTREVALATIAGAIAVMLAGGAVALVIGLIASFLISGSLARPVVAMTEAMNRLAEGKLDTEVPAQTFNDEIGRMAAAVNVFKENAQEVEKRRVQDEQDRKAEQARAAKVKEFTSNFEDSVRGVVSALSSTATQLQANAESMSTSVDASSAESAAVAAATEQASANVQTVAAAAEELSRSVQEIGSQVANSTEVARKAVTDADRTNAKVQELSDAAERINEVIALITDIAEQTNLLALNATIEAARAGEAGKGFAVVASEVKALANQTTQATEDIGKSIKGIQGSIGESVTAIQEIAEVVREIDQIAAAIAAAVEEQTAATQEIARNTQQAAQGTEEVTTKIASVKEATNVVGGASNEVLTASGELRKQFSVLETEVEGFLSNVREAA